MSQRCLFILTAAVHFMGFKDKYNPGLSWSTAPSFGMLCLKEEVYPIQTIHRKPVRIIRCSANSLQGRAEETEEAGLTETTKSVSTLFEVLKNHPKMKQREIPFFCSQPVQEEMGLHCSKEDSD